jgi:hypothetical protein
VTDENTEPEDGIAEGITPEPVKPLWKGWNEPKQPSEALALGEDYARMEGLWCSGVLFTLRNKEENTALADEGAHEELNCDCEECKVRKIALARIEEKGLTCGDIQACGIGILIMSVLDGPAVKSYFTLGDEGQKIEAELIKHKVGGPASVFLAAGFAKVTREEGVDDTQLDLIIDEPDDLIKTYIDGPKDKRQSTENFRIRKASAAKTLVIGVNDGGEEFPLPEGADKGSRGLLHHARIVKGFQYAREFALRHEHLLGFPGHQP